MDHVSGSSKRDMENGLFSQRETQSFMQTRWIFVDVALLQVPGIQTGHFFFRSQLEAELLKKFFGGPGQNLGAQDLYKEFKQLRQNNLKIIYSVPHNWNHPQMTLFPK